MATKKAKGEGKKRSHVLSETLTLENPKKKRSKKAKPKREGRKRKSGPRLPSSLRKELDLLNPNPRDPADSDGEEEWGAEDVYEYEEPVPQEESKKNRRFDPVENYEYELPDDFQDEEVPSDDEDIPSDQSEEDEDGDRHLRMLEGITGIPGEAFNGKDREKVVFSDVQGDSGDGKISINDFLDPLHGKPGYSKLRKRLHQLEKKPALQAPLPKVERERLERKVAYEHSKKDITKWEPLVKKNREAPTLYFEEDVDVGFSTVGAIASEFQPRTEFEKKMALLVRDPEVADAYWKDGSRLLELNKISIDDVRDRQNRLAKMRSLLFRHEMKAKHIKKIKSKTYHRLLKKDKLKAASAEMEMDPEAIKEHSMKQEFKRAEERMTLKHKNSSKWAKRILKRGLNVQDEGTRTAISEQLHQHALLTRKMNSVKDNSSSDDSSDDDLDELSPGEETEGVSNLLNRAKEKTIKVLEDENEMPKSGVLTLPFMERGLKKQEDAAYEEARLALQEYEASLGQLKDGDGAECQTSDKVSGRKVFGPTKGQPQKQSNKIQSDYIKNSDSEDDIEVTEHKDEHEMENRFEDVQNGSAYDESQMGQEAVFKNFSNIVRDPGPKTTYEVAMFVSDSWKKMKGETGLNTSSQKPAAFEKHVLPVPDIKMKGENGLDTSSQKPAAFEKHVLPVPDIKEMDQSSDSDSDEEMVDGMSSGAKPYYELPSQADLIHHAFAGDDVEAEFEKDKMEILNEENPEPEKPVLLPGWGQWTHVQQKKGVPSWMLQQHEKAKRKREEELKKRKDANLKHVIISEKIDKKAEKLHAKTLPYPYTSKEVYEQSIRMPIGPEYNPAISVGALNRPAVVKKAGIIIKPINYEEVDPHENAEEPNQRGQKPKTKKRKTAGVKTSKKA